MSEADVIAVSAPQRAAVPTCRHCGAELHRTFVDLGKSPLCESFLGADQLDQGEPFYPLHVRICAECLLVQLEAYVAGEEIFQRLRLLLVLLGLLGRARARATRRDRSSASASAPDSLVVELA